MAPGGPPLEPCNAVQVQRTLILSVLRILQREVKRIMVHDLNKYPIRIFEEEAIISVTVLHPGPPLPQDRNSCLPDMNFHQIEQFPGIHRQREMAESDSLAVILPLPEPILYRTEYDYGISTISDPDKLSRFTVGPGKPKGRQGLQVEYT